ncbi:unnamed protein product [Adineta steineri]|uniref:EGF-like domain-containing protein n=1 Tax=Adineta steineri TaxID=433720 RepID=A0A815ELK4_9BILA|nr:unnamed protein product [Adineta steineri]
MLSIVNSICWFNILIVISESLSLPYNQPRFSSCAIWDINATTVIGSSPLGSSPYGLSINKNNNLYVTSRKKNNTQIWSEGAGSSTTTFSIDLAAPAGIFVTDTKDVYIDNGLYKNEVIIWPFNQTNRILVMNVSGRCHSLFIDINNTLYCSMGDLHQIVSKLLNDTANTLPTIIAGNGSNGLMANLLSTPCGIFVDTNFDLYVADSGNHRIQLFHFGQSNGTTVVGDGSPISFALNSPSDVILDADGYLFIVDQGKNRIIGSGPYGYRCIAGCSELKNTTADTLNAPFGIAFDSYGNLFVVDTGNSRIQKFVLRNNSVACIESTTETTSMLLSTNLDEDTTILTTTLEYIETVEVYIEVSTTVSRFITKSDYYFVPENCINFNYIGVSCNQTSNPCDMLRPCQNSGTCYSNISTFDRYSCLCANGFSGSNCQYDYRLCKSNKCWNNGEYFLVFTKPNLNTH